MSVVDHERPSALADAASAIAASAHKIVENRLELARLEARQDVASMFRAVAFGGAAVASGVVAVGTAGAALVWLLAQWVPIAAALGLMALLASLAAGALTVAARRGLPGDTVEAPALPASGMRPHGGSN